MLYFIFIDTAIMAAVLQTRGNSLGCLLCLGKQVSRVSQVRTNVKYVVNNPRKYPKQLKYRIFREITRPIEYVDESKEFPCPKLERLNKRSGNKNKNKNELDEFEKFMEGKFIKMFEENKLIAVCQPMPCESKLQMEYNMKLKQAGFGIRNYNNSMMRRVSEQLGYGAIHPLLIGKNVYLIHKEPEIHKMLKLLRKIDAFVLLGAIVDGQILSRTGLLEYTQMPNIELQRGELVSILNLAAGGRTHSILSSHQQQLSTSLEQYVKQSDRGPEDSS